jgi:hypothetical protein
LISIVEARSLNSELDKAKSKSSANKILKQHENMMFLNPYNEKSREELIEYMDTFINREKYKLLRTYRQNRVNLNSSEPEGDKKNESKLTSIKLSIEQNDNKTHKVVESEMLEG